MLINFIIAQTRVHIQCSPSLELHEQRKHKAWINNQAAIIRAFEIGMATSGTIVHSNRIIEHHAAANFAVSCMRAHKCQSTLQIEVRLKHEKMIQIENH